MKLLLLLFSFLGLADSAYLSYLHIKDDFECIEGLDCSEVLTSSYAYIGSIPLSVFGVAAFLGFAYLAFGYLSQPQVEFYKKGLFYWTLIGSLASLYLISLQVFVLKAFCYFCLFSSGLWFLSFIIMVYLTQLSKPKKDN